MSDDMNKGNDRKPMTRRQLMAQAMARVSAVALAVGAGALMTPRHAHAGYGRCSVSGCPCQAFMPVPGNSYMCENCGHNYSLHW